MTALDSGAGQLVDLVYVRNRCARPCCLGEQIKRHIVIVADRRKGQIGIGARVGITRNGPLPQQQAHHHVGGDRVCAERMPHESRPEDPQSFTRQVWPVLRGMLEAKDPTLERVHVFQRIRKREPG
jgi:hypothetical protein